jgi:hypothetical protein
LIDNTGRKAGNVVLGVAHHLPVEHGAADQLEAHLFYIEVKSFYSVKTVILMQEFGKKYGTIKKR